jgi:hypothetical protein
MNIDERLEFLMQSTESLHASLQEVSAQQHVWIERQKIQEQKEIRLRRAMLEGIRTFLEGLNRDEGQENGKQ